MRSLAQHARETVAQWKVDGGLPDAGHSRQSRRAKVGEKRDRPTEEHVLSEARTREGEETVVQWDAGNKQKAKQEAGKAFREAIAEDARALAVQGEWFRLHQAEKADRGWGQVVRRQKEAAREWCVKAAVQLLPDATNKRRWKWGTAEGYKCACGEVATAAHTLSACKLSLQRYKWRHDGVLAGMVESLRRAAGER